MSLRWSHYRQAAASSNSAISNCKPAGKPSGCGHWARIGRWLPLLNQRALPLASAGQCLALAAWLQRRHRHNSQERC